MVLRNGDGIDRYESKNRGFIRDKFWGGDRTRFVPELRRAASTHIIEARGAIISRTRGRLSVIGIGFAGTVFEKLHDEDHSTRMIKIQFQSPSNSISWYQMDRRGLLHIFSQREDRDSLLVPGNRPKLINALLEHSYFVYALTECWWEREAPAGWGASAPLGEHNELEKESPLLKGTRTTYYTHLEPWEAEPGIVKRKGPPARRMQGLQRNEGEEKVQGAARIAARHVPRQASVASSRPVAVAARVVDGAAASAGPPCGRRPRPRRRPHPRRPRRPPRVVDHQRGPGAREESTIGAREEQWKTEEAREVAGRLHGATVHGPTSGTRQTRAPGPSETRRTSAQEG